MNYKNSLKIKAIIDKSKKVILILHVSPDQDSTISNLLMSKYLDTKKIAWDLICTDEVPGRFKSIYKLDRLKDKVDPNTFDFLKYDLFIALDVNQKIRFGLSDEVKLPQVINIDHHYTENNFGGIKINDSSFSSTAEMMFYILEDFGYKLTTTDNNLVLLGILTDTEMFSYGTTPRVFKTVSRLLENGANYDEVDETINRSNTPDQMAYWAEALKNIKVDKKYKFAYTSMNRKMIDKYPEVLQGTRTVADKFIRTIADTNFGMVMTETKEGYLKISVRSRVSSFGLSELLKRLNGGGHFSGGGGKIDKPYKEAIQEALETARKFSKEFPNGSK